MFARRAGTAADDSGRLGPAALAALEFARPAHSEVWKPNFVWTPSADDVAARIQKLQAPIDSGGRGHPPLAAIPQLKPLAAGRNPKMKPLAAGRQQSRLKPLAAGLNAH